jgi:hypothetical protein
VSGAGLLNPLEKTRAGDGDSPAWRGRKEGIR